MGVCLIRQRCTTTSWPFASCFFRFFFLFIGPDSRLLFVLPHHLIEASSFLLGFRTPWAVIISFLLFWFSPLLFGKEAQKQWVRSACFIPIYFRVAIFAMDEGPGLGLTVVEQKDRAFLHRISYLTVYYLNTGHLDF